MQRDVLAGVRASTSYERAFSLASEAGRPAVLIDTASVTGREPTMAERYQLGGLRGRCTGGDATPHPHGHARP